MIAGIISATSGQVKIAGAAVHEMAGFVGDGRTIFVSTRDEGRKRSAWLVGADGSNPRRLPLPENRALFVNTFSPDGTKIAYVKNGNLAVLDPSSGRETFLTSHGGGGQAHRPVRLGL